MRKKKGNPVIYKNTEVRLEDMMLNEISRIEKDKYSMILFTCGI